jgi:hypothetical protein
MNQYFVLPHLDPRTYQRHSLHSDDAIWLEKNCYGDLWIELLHALELDPLAILPFTLAIDFEGDQWTFFKPSQEELRSLYGIDVQELTVWRPLIEHAVEHLGAGKLIATEADAYWLPDTSGTDYRSKHTKTTILLTNLNTEAQTLGYFHNAGYFELAGEDFRQLFGLDIADDTNRLPLFAELVRIERRCQKSSTELSAESLSLLKRHVERRPSSNPFLRFAQRFVSDLPSMQASGLPHYHAWAFASIRQAGAAFELASANLRWQAGLGHPILLEAANSFQTIAQGNKALILKGARAVNSGKTFDSQAMIEEMALAWERGMNALNRFFDAVQ